jgi:coenzyme PQQ biosynthesis protein PqqD
MPGSGHPKLARGCRLKATAEGDVLLMPERMLRMNGCGSEILKRCDGSRTVEDIVAELQALYTGVEIEKLNVEVESFLSRLRDEMAIIAV